jgi:hypothetical protein
MPSVTISDRAVDLILTRMNEPAIAGSRKDDSIPLLNWASRTYSTDFSGHRTEHGPQFFFSWSNAGKIEEYHNLMLTLPNGEALALGPGGYFQTGSHAIDERDGRLTLVSSP